MSKLSDAMGPQSAAFLQSAIGSAANPRSGALATLICVVSLIVTASGVFGAMQTALNAIWRANPEGTTVERLIRARLTSLTLVVALGFSGIASSYGAGGSVLAALLSIYYSAQIVLFGAEFTRAYADYRGSRQSAAGRAAADAQPGEAQARSVEAA
jgi:uncharacterized BrkB/YihY/UPF0761 family membrane protein